MVTSTSRYDSNTLIAYTDGASKGNPGHGGWGAIIRWPNGMIKEMGEYHPSVTNNQMEMLAVVAVLKQIKDFSGPSVIHSDSRYLINGITNWVFSWARNGWMTSNGQAVLNQNIWQQLLQLVTARKKQGFEAISWNYVPGHAGIDGNERADEIASNLASHIPIDLFEGSDSQYHLDLCKRPPVPTKKTSKSSSGSKKKAYSYLSYVDQTLVVHKTWAECEARVKGRSGAKFKKAGSAEEEDQIKRQWGLI